MPRHQRFALLLILLVTFVEGCYSRSETANQAFPEKPLQIDQVIGSVKTNGQGQLTDVDFRDVPATNDDLKMLAGQSAIKVVKLNGKDGQSTVDDRGVSVLGGLTNLKVLALDYLPVTSAGIASLKPLKDLRELLLAKTDINDEALVAIAELKNLTKLRIAGTAITDDGIANLTTLSRLRSLDVSECQALSDVSAASFAELFSLQQLNLWRVPITDSGLQQIASLENLQSLNLDNTKVTDAGLSSLSMMTGLTFLHLGSTDITDEGIKSLETLVNLKDLIVTRTGVTEAGVLALQSKLPDTKIQLKYEGDQ